MQYKYENKCIRITNYDGKHTCTIAHDSTPFMRYYSRYVENAKVIIEDDRLIVDGTEVTVHETCGDYENRSSCIWIYPVKKSSDPMQYSEPKFIYYGKPLEEYFDVEGIDLFDPNVTKLGYRHWWHIFIGKKTRRFVSYYRIRYKERKNYQLICTNWSLNNADGHNVI